MAQCDCPTDLRTEWLGVGGTWPGTKFDETHRDYINGLSLSSLPVFFSSISSVPGSPHGSREEGADACADVAEYYDWREGACRAILYISDEPLDQGSPQDPGDNAATMNAITVCNNNNVTVFAHLASGTGHDSNAATIANYKDLTSKTGGKLIVGGSGTEAEYTEILQDVICNGCGGCIEIAVPEIKPCISISWGDSECDCLETDDFEILCISVCNCYSNVSFDNFIINMIQVTNADGSGIAVLPDGTPSVQAIPLGPICFGTIPPCEDEASCVSREFVINTRGAKAGDYKVMLYGICFDVNFCYYQDSCFEFKLCKS